MSTVAFAWVVAVVAAGGGLAAWLPWVMRNVNNVVFADQIAKLCHARNADRARKLCSAAPHAPVVAAVGACLAALDANQGEPESETIARLREIYRGVLRERLAAASRWAWIGFVAIGAAAVAAYLVAAGHAPPPALAPAGIATLLVASSWRHARRTAVQGVEQCERLLPIMAATRR